MLALGLTGFAFFAELSFEYVTRGDVSSFIGRTDIWKFAIQKIEQRQLLGWSFEAEGENMKAREFTIWWGP